MSNYLNLLKEFATTDFKLRYQGSLLGVFWSFLRPLTMFAILYFVFSKFARFDIPAYQFYLLLGIVMWNFFSEATTSSMMSLFARAGLLKKIKFERNIIVVSTVVVAFINFLVSLLVFICLLLLYKSFHISSIITALILFLNLFLVVLGASLFLAVLNSKFKDISHLWEILIQMGFWITPIVYAPQMVPEQYSWILSINPMFQIIEHSRNALIYDTVLPLFDLLKIFIFSLVVFSIGFAFFRSREDYLIEEL